jgi:bacillithiol system protein YtxJ
MARMEWMDLPDEGALELIDERSRQQPVLLFKNSPQCLVSSTMLRRFEHDWTKHDLVPAAPFLLDVLAQRTLSQQLARHYGVPHASPQLLVIRHGKCVHSASHFEIRLEHVPDLPGIS